jgi:Ni/Co efflux regulator RcnB
MKKLIGSVAALAIIATPAIAAQKASSGATKTVTTKSGTTKAKTTVTTNGDTTTAKTTVTKSSPKKAHSKTGHKMKKTTHKAASSTSKK